MKRTYIKAWLSRKTYLSILICLSVLFNSSLEVFALSGYVGDIIWLSKPSIPYGAIDKGCQFSSNASELLVYSSSGSVEILEYFTGTRKVTCDYYYMAETGKDAFGGAIYTGYHESFDYDITCNAIELSNIPQKLNMTVGEQSKIDWYYSPSSKKEPKVEFKSNRNDVAWVDSYDYIKAVGVGTATITVINHSGNDKQISVTVIGSDPVPVTSITLNKNSLSLQTGQSETLTATVKPENATDKTLTWSSKPEGIVTISSAGRVTAIASGETKVYCTANDGSGVQDICTVKVTDAVIKVTSITLNKTSLSLQTRQSETLTATVKPGNATDKTVTWSSKPEGIVTVSSTGEVTAIASGETKVYCTANDGSGVQATCDVKVNAEGIAINATNFPDENFRNYLLSRSYGKDGVLTESEISGVTSIFVYSKNISSLSGIEFFTALKELNCYKNQLTTLDVSKNRALTYLCCYSNQLTALDVSKNTALTDLQCGDNPLFALDVSKNMALTSLSCHDNQLTTLDVSNNTALTMLFCGGNQLTALDVSKNTALTTLSCDSNQLTNLDVSKNTALTYLGCYNNQLTTIDLSNNQALTTLSFWRNRIKGKGMDELISSLPYNTIADECNFFVIDNRENDEGNVCTKAQVAAVKAKGWTPKYYNGSKIAEYEGSDPVMPEINADVNSDGSVDVADISTIISVMAGEGTSVATQANLDKVKVLDVDPIAIQPSGTSEIVVRMDYDTSEEITGWNFTLHLPEGISAVKNNSGKLIPKISYEVIPSVIKLNSGLTVSERSDGSYTFVCIDTKNQKPMSSTHGELLRIPVAADNNVKGILIGTIDKIGLTNKSTASIDYGNISDVNIPFVSGGDKIISCDVNGDGTVDVADISAVITRMAELARMQRVIAEEE